MPSLNVSSNPKPSRRELHEYKSQMNSTFIYMDPANATPETQGHKDVKHRYSSSRRRQRLRHRLRWRGFGTAAIGLLRRTCFQGSSPNSNRNIHIILILVLVIVLKIVNNCRTRFWKLVWAWPTMPDQETNMLGASGFEPEQMGLLPEGFRPRSKPHPHEPLVLQVLYIAFLAGDIGGEVCRTPFLYTLRPDYRHIFRCLHPSMNSPQLYKGGCLSWRVLYGHAALRRSTCLQAIEEQASKVHHTTGYHMPPNPGSSSVSLYQLQCIMQQQEGNLRAGVTLSSDVWCCAQL